jgi:LmbE family N-acetylglucosaminyl deacetylase
VRFSKHTISRGAILGISLAVSVASLLAAPGDPQKVFSGETKMRLMLESLNNVSSVMMIAAHPDDENNALLAYLARGRHVRTAYLSLTRGEGGQNLIGSEQGDALGMIRTQELLAEHRIDGSEQYFTRAIDFGFSKTADETLKKWPRDQVLGDVVWNIRRFRPDIIILRFSGTPRDGHGHHQASAILGKEAFSAAADPSRFPEQLKYVKTWQALRLMTNVANFTDEQRKEIDKIPAADKLALDLGAYAPELGYSWGEIAGMSRSLHRSQSQGSPERRGENINYLVTNSGDKPSKDLFDGIRTSWARVPNGAAVGALLRKAADAYTPLHPEAILPILAQARPLMAAIDDPIARRKLVELDEMIAAAGGVWVEALADKPTVAPGGNIKVTLSALRRGTSDATLLGAKWIGVDAKLNALPAPKLERAVLASNKPNEQAVTLKIPADESYSHPYWLELPKSGAMYSVRDPQMIGIADSPAVLSAEFLVHVGGVDIALTRPVERRYVDRVYGELSRNIAIVPPVALDFGGTALVFADTKPRAIEVPVRSVTGKVSGDVRLDLPNGWKAEPAARHFDLAGADEQALLTFQLTPPAATSQGVLRAVATVDGKNISSNVRVIDYPHIPTETLFPPSEASLVRADIRTLARNIGYVMGAGDEMPGSLRQMGCDVTLLTKDDLVHGDLSRFDAIVTGVRAWNTRADLRANYSRVYKYVEDGGTLVVQYNVADAPAGPPVAPPPAANAAAANSAPPAAQRGAANNPARAEADTLTHMGPYPLKESRDNKDRVTVEESPVTFPNPQLSLLHTPNEITMADFEGWIQERGLDFATEWDPRYLPVIESHDPEDKPMLGGELYTRYGKGAYVFSAFSWFRELPAGVPGAYRLFANMLSAGKASQ